jgi:hypothetical protein
MFIPPPAPSTPPLPHGVYGLRSLSSIQKIGENIKETVYKGRDNTIELVLSVDGKPINHNYITRAQIVMVAAVLDSAVSPVLFDLTNVDRLVMELGGSELIAGHHAATLIVYDSGDPNGLVWGSFNIDVKN